VRRLLLPLLLLLAPVAQAQAPAAPHVRLVSGNQVLMASWEAVPGAVSYEVDVYHGDVHIGPINVTATSYAFQGAFNGVPYALTVRARNAAGELGPASAPVAALPTNPHDARYFALAIAAIWVAVVGYCLLLARGQQRLEERLIKLEQHGERA